MKYGIAVWNYMQQGVSLCERVREFAGFGFDAVSFMPNQIVALADADRADLSALMNEADLTATVHGKCDITTEQVEAVAEQFGDRLHAITLDAAWAPDSRGSLYDGPVTAAALARIRHVTSGTAVRFGAEDFPRDELALEHFRRDLGSLLDAPRYGMLIDVGHMNMNLRQMSYYRGVTPEAYFDRLPLPLIEVHLHDNDGTKDQHGHIGLGNTDFAAVARGLHVIGFDGVSTVEIAPRFHGSTPEESMPRAKASLDTWRGLWEGV